MKRITGRALKSASAIAVGLVLARGAQATVTLVGDTDITFDNASFAANNSQVPFNYGSNASSTNTPVNGVVIGSSGLGLGTPDVTLDWTSKAGVGRNGTPTLFQYVKGGPWDSAELFNSTAGNSHDLILSAPSFAAVSVLSFNFFPYLNDGATYSYTVSVWDQSNPSHILSQQVINPPSNASKDLVTVNAAGALGESLVLDITRNTPGGTGDPFNMAIDDVKFSEATPEPGTIALICLGLGGMGIWARRRRNPSSKS